ncbi:MAG: DUF58 domain-containing protein [Candidatus Firestonebacteria bacterium]|nr:DUF58 domain-containing protein [Candidatus Firestonebacteria bacterium]
MEESLRFLQPNVLAKFTSLELVARLVVEGFLSGLHKSPSRGFNVEFAEHRQYMPGDEIRYIDWKAFAKTDKFYIKQFEEESNLRSYILFDCSRSMEYGSPLSKFNYGKYLVATLSYLMLHQKDSVGLITFNEKIMRYIPPRTMHSHIHEIIKELNVVSTQSRTDVSTVFHELALKIKRRGLIVVISDLFDTPEKVINALKHFRHKKHEVIVFQVLDENELEFNFKETSKFVELESNKEIIVNPEAIREEYKKSMKQFIRYYRRMCYENAIDYVLVNTSTPYDYALFSYLSRRTHRNVGAGIKENVFNPGLGKEE